MKRFLLCFTLTYLSFTAAAQTNIWIGGSSGNWSVNTNWSLGHYPAATEDVVINTNAGINVDVFTAGYNDIRSLYITGGANVVLSCSVDGARYLRMSAVSDVTRGLKIDAGSLLTFDATNTTGTGNWICDLTGNAGVTGLIEGSLLFAGTGAGNGSAGLNVYTSPAANAALVVNATGSIIYLDDSGNTNSAAGAFLTMQSGAVFEQRANGGTIPDGDWNAGSFIKVTTAGTTPPVFAGSNYGNLEINCPNIASPLYFSKNIFFNDVNLINTGASSVAVKGPGTIPYTLTINGNLTVAAASALELAPGTEWDDSSGNIKVKGNVVNNGVIDAYTGSNNNKFELNGVVNQQISGSGAWYGNHLHVVMNNPGGATLLSPVNLRCHLALTNGKIKTTSANILMMAMEAGDGFAPGWSGGSAASFVDGPMLSVSDRVSFTFPVGKGNFFAPISYRHSLNYLLTDTFTAEYFRSNPQAAFGSDYDTAGNPEVIHHISYLEYWRVQKNPGGMVTHRIEAWVNPTSFCTDLNTTFIARLDSSTNQWKNCGNFGRNLINAGPPYVTGEIWGAYVPLGAGIFTLATSDANNPLSALAQGPLPVRLITFDASRLSFTQSLLYWKTAEYCLPGAKFEIQRAGGDRDFKNIATIEGSGISLFYNYTDNDLRGGVNYYRLKMTDEAGIITYSKTVVIINGTSGLLLTSLTPSVITSRALLTIAAAESQKINIMIIDMQGRVVQRRNYSIAAGNTSIELPAEGLPAGVYQLIGISAEGKTNVLRFVKQ